MQPIRPIPINASHRVQSITPMPQVRRTNTFRPVSQSPPPFEFQNNNSSRLSKLEDIFGSFQPTQQPGNVALLARGISLLSITQLRELLRDYSLPTGGNKHILVNRLIIYLETFGQNQQELFGIFSTKLKKLLSVDSDDVIPVHHSGGIVPQQLPLELEQRIFNTSPSCLYEITKDLLIPFGPVIIQPNYIGLQQNFSLSSTSSNENIPILQFVPYYQETSLRKLTFQLGGILVTLRDNVFWTDVSDFVNRQGMFQIISIEPPLPMVALIRWMRKVPVLQLVQRIITEREPVAKSLMMPTMAMNGICPLTRKLIARPARGAKCVHADCFDLTGYLCYAIKNKSWICPICHNSLYIEDIRIDPNYFSLAKPISV